MAPEPQELIWLKRDPKIGSEYDRAKVSPYNGADPRPPLVV